MLIKDNKALEQCCSKVLTEEVIAFDTEFMRDRTYYPKLSLVQIATKETAFAVDMLSGLDYSPLAKVLAADNLLKVIHSARQDLELLYNFFGFIPKNLFDTQIAVLFLGYKDSPSFELIVSDFLDKKVNKELQFSDWLARPLSVDQLKYAVMDANLLYELFFAVKKRLNDLNRFEWALEESNLIKCGDKFTIPIENMLIKFTNFLSKEKDLIICYNLLFWREEKAKSLDTPRGHVIKDEVIIKLCHEKPDTLEKLSKFRLHSSLEGETLNEILEIISFRAIDEKEKYIIKNILNSRKTTFLNKNNLFFMLKILVEVIAKKLEVYEPLLATTTDILLFANDRESKIENGWRKEAIGSFAHAMRKGKITLGYKDGNFFISEV